MSHKSFPVLWNPNGFISQPTQLHFVDFLFPHGTWSEFEVLHDVGTINVLQRIRFQSGTPKPPQRFLKALMLPRCWRKWNRVFLRLRGCVRALFLTIFTIAKSTKISSVDKKISIKPDAFLSRFNILLVWKDFSNSLNFRKREISVKWNANFFEQLKVITWTMEVHDCFSCGSLRLN